MAICGNITQTNVASELMHHHLTQRLSLEMDLPLSSPIQEDQKHPHTTALNAQLQNRKCRTEHQSGQHLDHLVNTWIIWSKLEPQVQNRSGKHRSGPHLDHP